MPRHEHKTYFLYSVGRKPDELSLGTLLLDDYANPNRRHVTQDLLSDDQMRKYVSSTRIEGTVINFKSSPKLGVTVDAANLITFDPQWSTSNEEILIAKSGIRTEIKEAQDFLNDVVLRPGSKARTALKLWISASQADYVLKLKWLRSPKIWMLSGQYLLDNASALNVETAKVGIEAGVSSTTVGALTGIPIGGSIDIGSDKKLVVGNKWGETLVWAAQYRLLDVRYLRVEADKLAVSLPNVLPLSETFSKGKLRNDTTVDNAFQLGVLGDEKIVEAGSGDSKEAEQYTTQLEKAIAQLESFGESDEADDADDEKEDEKNKAQEEKTSVTENKGDHGI